MPIIRTEKTNGYTVISNKLLCSDLSFKAKGLLCYMLSLPDEWKFSVKGLCLKTGEGKSIISSALKELQINGYLKIKTIMPGKSQSGRIEHEYYIYEEVPAADDIDVSDNPQKQDTQKQSTEKQDTEFQTAEKQNTEFQSTENPPLINNNIINTEKPNTKRINTKKTKKEKDKEKRRSFSFEYNDILKDIEDTSLRELCREYIKMREHIRAPVTPMAMKLIISKLFGFESSIPRQKQILINSITNSWKDIYPLKEGFYTEEEEKLFKGGIYV